MAEVPNGSKLLENVVVVEKKLENGSKNGNQNGQNTAEVIAGMKDQEDTLKNTTSTTQTSGDYNYTYLVNRYDKFSPSFVIFGMYQEFSMNLEPFQIANILIEATIVIEVGA